MFWVIVGLAILFFFDFLSSSRKKGSGRDEQAREHNSEESRARIEANREKIKRDILIRRNERQAIIKDLEDGSDNKNDVNSGAQLCISDDPAELLLARKITDRINRSIRSKNVALTVVLRQLDISKNAGEISRAFVSKSGFLPEEFQGASKWAPDSEVKTALNALATSAIGLSGDPSKTEVFTLLNLQNLIDDWGLKEASFLSERLMHSLKLLISADPSIIPDLDKAFPVRGQFDFELFEKPSDNLVAATKLINKLHGITGKLRNYILDEAKSKLAGPEECLSLATVEDQTEDLEVIQSDGLGQDQPPSSLARAVQKRGVPYLTHFTEVSNLPSIFQKGIHSRGALDQSGQAFSFNDQLRLDGRRMGISLSVGFPNYKMFYKYRIQDVQKKWAVIRVDPSVLWENDCLFFPNNAADGKMINITDNVLKGEEAFELMYIETVGKVTRDKKLLKPYDPTDPQAEVMVFGDIPLSKVIDVVFEDAGLMVNFATRFPHVNMVYGPELFGSRDYARRQVLEF